MSRALRIGALLVAAVAIAYGGFWFGQRHAGGEHRLAQVSAPAGGPGAPAPAPERKILYYKDPMGRPDLSAEPKKDEMGMDYLPVYEDEEEPIAPPSSATPAPSGERKILYYRNPMGLPDTSPAPKKDPMGMDYIPVYEGEASGDSALVTVTPERVQMLGVRTEPAARRSLARAVRAAGTVRFSERGQAVVPTKFKGWIEKLHVNTTGAGVRRGEPLLRVYSPLLLQTEQEYVDSVAMAAAGDADGATASRRLVEGALQRLRYLDVPEAEIRRLQRERRASRWVVWPAPFSGVVVEKLAVEGMRFMPGEPLYRIAEISPIWVLAEVFEQDLAHVAAGQPATVAVKAFPGRTFEGWVAFIYPTVGAATRTATVRIELPNPDGALKEEMYATVSLEPPACAPEVLAVPDSAVIDNGVRQVVLVEHGEGRFEPRAVRLGTRAQGYSEVLEGVAEGERVVVSANFLIDAESNLKAALAGFTAGGPQH